MDLTEQLNGRYGNTEAFATLTTIRNEQKFVQFAEYLFHEDRIVSRNAAWVLTKATDAELQQLAQLQDRFIDLVMQTPNSSLRRLTLNLLERMPMEADDIRADFLDFCLAHMASLDEPPGIQSLCLKLACKMCAFYPELMGELNRTVDAIHIEHYSPALRSVIKHMRKSAKPRGRKRSHQTFS